jgi:arylsulfatase A-like enzyme
MDPHSPYRFHSRFNPAGSTLKDLSPVARLRARYDSEVAYTDHHIGRLLEVVPRENTYIIFLADHGESLHEHNYVGHTRRLYQTTLHAPLMIAGPGISRGKFTAPVSGVDIAPTILALANLTAPWPMAGRNALAGQGNDKAPRVVELYGGDIPTGDAIYDELATRPPQLQAVYNRNWKLIESNKGHLELYDLQDDPAEEKNRAQSHPEQAAALRRHIQEWNNTIPRRQGKATSLTKADEEALKALGYIE